MYIMSKTVCVITGGGSGMGLAAAKYMPKDKIIVVTGRTLSKLEKAVCELTELGYEAHAKPAILPTATPLLSLQNLPQDSARSKTSSTPQVFRRQWQNPNS